MSTPESDVHRDNRQSSKASSEADVRNILMSFEKFVNLFSVDKKNVLFCISSRLTLAKDAEKHVLEDREKNWRTIPRQVCERAFGCQDRSSRHLTTKRKDRSSQRPRRSLLRYRPKEISLDNLLCYHSYITYVFHDKTLKLSSLTCTQGPCHRRWNSGENGQI
jgi:hypothetical protein